ncbi:uncharacterized protein ARMOST_07719 [Armillaria ostoyae]|uniref:HAT C-terminal dimerisation domain-containing protein n=1 Tax=Armillaria ostoyae TaxID=47428 RepID=A0A284R6K2_ARMOS|nr:uncharacterized protein ARMOST_07719 [Armillaria ostoyae]
MLNWYYQLTDDSDVYHIAMVFHPIHKLDYFEQAGWKLAWIKDAKSIVQWVFDEKYRGHYDAIKEVIEITPPSTNMFKNLSMVLPPALSIQDELARYLGSPTEAMSDAIAWWLKNCKTYPSLSRMALDYLSIPDDNICGCRTSQTTQALMCLGNWSLLGFVEDKDVLAVARLPEVPNEEGDEDGDVLMPEGWDTISVKEN